MRNKGKIVISITSIVVILLLVFFYFSPYSIALLKSKSQFTVSTINSNVLYEAGAEENAGKIASYLNTAVKRVEEIHGLPFTKPFNVYVCNTQKSLNEYIANPPEAPVRGAVLFGNIFIAPSAFNWNGEDTHQGAILHELSHLHMKQYLGFWGDRVNIPVWFKEGLADYVCDCAGEGISDEDAVNAIKNGYHFVPDENGNIFKVKRASDYGMDYPMFHKQTKMFVTFLFEYNQKGLQDFLLDILSNKSFAESFRNRTGKDLQEMWQLFIQHLSDK